MSVVNAMLIHDFSDNTIRKLKTDRADALKIANYALTFWDALPQLNGEDETRLLLKMQSRANERITGHFFPCEEILSAAFVLFYSRTIGLCSLLESTKV